MFGMPVDQPVRFSINGQWIPGRIADGGVAQEERSFVGRDGKERTATAYKQAVLSLRENQTTGKPYITLTFENLQFLFRRNDVVQGLDAIGDVKLPLTALEDQRAEDFIAYQAERGTSFSVESLLTGPIPEPINRE